MPGSGIACHLPGLQEGSQVHPEPQALPRLHIALGLRVRSIAEAGSPVPEHRNPIVAVSGSKRLQPAGPDTSRYAVRQGCPDRPFAKS